MFHGSELGAERAQACALGGIAFSQARRLERGENWLFLQLTQQVGQKSLLRSSVEMAHVGFRDGVGRRLKLARWAASLSPKLAAWREGGTGLPAAYAAGWTEIAVPQLWGDDAWGMDGKHGFIDVGNGRQKSLLRGFESVLRGVE